MDLAAATGIDKPMVLQRSVTNLDGSWQDVHTNQITIENPFGSINYVDSVAKGMPVALYRVVSPETAATSGITPAANVNKAGQ